MKPDWKDAPEWAQWLAMDGYGLWVWYATKPLFIEWGHYWSSDHGKAEYATDVPDESGIDWDHAFDTLEPRP